MSIDLTTEYLGLKLSNPLIVAACPITREITKLEQLEQAGASAAVLYSLFAEQFAHDELWRLGHSDATTEHATAAPRSHDYAVGIDGYLKNIKLAKQAVSIPIIGSLNGGSPGDWTQHARLIQDAGADALELNVYFVPTDPTLTGSQVEQQYIDIVAAVANTIEIPLSVKLGPFFSSLPNMAARLQAEGVSGLVLFNRFLQPDIDVNTLGVSPRLTLSTRDELRLPLRWIAILRSQLNLSLAASSGAHCGEDVAKLILAGADVVSFASALLRNGQGHLNVVLDELLALMNSKNFTSIANLRGFIQRRQQANASVFERANYLRAIVSFDDQPPEHQSVPRQHDDRQN